METVYSCGATSDSKTMRVYLYAWYESNIESTKAGHPIVESIRSTCQELFDYGAVPGYTIERFPIKKESYDYYGNKGDYVTFRDYLEADNGSNTFLNTYIGCHTFIHSKDCDTTNVTAEGGGDDCGSTPDGSAFNDCTWAVTSDACSSEDLVRNSAIQEVVHQFIRAYQYQVEAMLGDGDEDGEITYYDEHTLGKVESSTDGLTPMLTYHSDMRDHGDCRTGLLPRGFSQNMTSCTKDAVKYTAEDQC